MFIVCFHPVAEGKVQVIGEFRVLFIKIWPIEPDLDPVTYSTDALGNFYTSWYLGRSSSSATDGSVVHIHRFSSSRKHLRSMILVQKLFNSLRAQT